MAPTSLVFFCVLSCFTATVSSGKPERVKEVVWGDGCGVKTAWRTEPTWFRGSAPCDHEVAECSIISFPVDIGKVWAFYEWFFLTGEFCLTT